MSIRTKLFVFIPALVILLNSIFFFIFQNSKLVLENHQVMMDRILLYKQISDESDQNLRSLHQYLIKQDSASQKTFLAHKRQLTVLKGKLPLNKSAGERALVLKDYENMISTLIEQENSTATAFEQKKLEVYTIQYIEAEKTAGYIKGQGQSLVDLELSFYQPIYKGIVQDTNKINSIGLLLFVVTFVLSILLAVWLSRRITVPINKLAAAAKQISQGDFSTKLPQRMSKDEVGILANAFSQMLKSIHELMKKNLESLEKDKLVKELELKALQNQINPHFLFNTLNVISKLAYIEGAVKASDLIVSVSNLLRYNLQKLDQPVTLKEEINHVKQYVAIQKARFRDRVSFTTEIDEAALDQLIPCLSLQPIIENAFVHGIEHLETGATIRLSVKEQKDYVEVRISDNGAGMSEQTKKILLDEQIDKPLPENGKPSTGLGTRNVFKRLKLFYDREDVVNINSQPGEGTVVCFYLPYQNDREKVD